MPDVLLVAHKPESEPSALWSSEEYFFPEGLVWERQVTVPIGNGVSVHATDRRVPHRIELRGSKNDEVIFRAQLKPNPKEGENNTFDYTDRENHVLYRFSASDPQHPR